MPKAGKPVRLGHVYVARRADGAFLLERRAERGLLGGMLGWPGSDWAAAPEPAPPLEADWRLLDAEVLHTFTHFHLRLKILVAKVDSDAMPERGLFLSAQSFSPAELPSVMRKVFDLARGALETCG